MRAVLRTLGTSVLSLLIPACGGIEPLGPTPVDQGVLVFMHSGFRGTSQQVGADVTDLTRIEGPCNIRVLPGYFARLYGDRNFRGAVLEVTEDVLDLKALRGDCSGSFDDCVSSIRVFKRQ